MEIKASVTRTADGTCSKEENNFPGENQAMKHAILSSVETVLVAFVMECLQQCYTELHTLQAMASLIVIQSTGYTKELFEGSL